VQLAVSQDAGGTLLAFPAQRRPIGGRRRQPLVEAATDDVHAAADTPPRPRRPAAQVEDALIGLVELDADLVEDGGPEPLGLGDRACQQRLVGHDAVRVHERLDAALPMMAGWDATQSAEMDCAST
jgi:hypothetical protein